MRQCAICGVTEYELELFPTSNGLYICSCCSAWGMDVPEYEDFPELAETEIFEEEDE